MEQRGGTQTSYDRVAGEYVRLIYGELSHKPLDRELLDRFAGRVRDLGQVLEIGCGPGHVARYLSERGVQITGLDLSPGMVEQARRLNPAIDFVQGDMRSLPAADGALAGIVAFYSIIHIPRAEVTAVLRELRRALRPGGLLFMAFHIGKDTTHLDELWGHEVDVDFVFFEPEEMSGHLSQAGFTLGEAIVREPYPDVEHPSRRAYLFATA